MTHRGVAEIAEKTNENKMCELSNVRDKPFYETAFELTFALTSLRPSAPLR
jgi:hypothetical protein